MSLPADTKRVYVPCFDYETGSELHFNISSYGENVGLLALCQKSEIRATDENVFRPTDPHKVSTRVAFGRAIEVDFVLEPVLGIDLMPSMTVHEGGNTVFLAGQHRVAVQRQVPLYGHFYCQQIDVGTMYGRNGVYFD